MLLVNKVKRKHIQKYSLNFNSKKVVINCPELQELLYKTVSYSYYEYYELVKINKSSCTNFVKSQKLFSQQNGSTQCNYITIYSLKFAKWE